MLQCLIEHASGIRIRALRPTMVSIVFWNIAAVIASSDIQHGWQPNVLKDPLWQDSMDGSFKGLNSRGIDIHTQRSYFRERHMLQ